MRPRLHHIALRCTDLDRSLSFYAEGLGLGDPYLWNAPPLVSRAAFLEADGRTWLELFDGGGTPAPPGEDAGLFHFALSVDDVRAAFDRAVAAGATVVEEPVTRTLQGDPPMRATMAFVLGPDGEPIELYRNDDL
jgi:catechol 2,3-dioxygenase-like lactoylglutathione lyase family enzyme